MPNVEPGGNFDDKLTFSLSNGKVMVDAQGPVQGDIDELCVWVVQRNGGDDAAATEMTTSGGRLQNTPGSNRWKMSAGQVGGKQLTDGSAFAMAIALIQGFDDKHQPTAKKAQLWAQSVVLEQAAATTPTTAA